MVTVGIIGCGKIAENHIKALRELGVNLLISDTNLETAQHLSKKYNAQLARAPEDLFSSSSVDVIDVCTPTIHHYSNIMKGILAKKHIFCEKPLCDEIRQAYEIKGAVANSSSVLMVGYLFRFHRAVQFAKDLVDGNILGDIYLSSFRLGARGEHRFWKHRKELGGGAINEVLVHELDLAIWLFNEPIDVKLLQAETIRPQRMIENVLVETDVEDYVLVKLTFQNTVAFCQADLVSPGYMNFFEIHGTNGSFFGSILNTMPSRLFLKKSIGSFRSGEHLQVFPEENVFKSEWEHFFRTMAAGHGNQNSIDDSIKIVEVLQNLR